MAATPSTMPPLGMALPPFRLKDEIGGGEVSNAPTHHGIRHHPFSGLRRRHARRHDASEAVSRLFRERHAEEHERHHGVVVAPGHAGADLRVARPHPGVPVASHVVCGTATQRRWQEVGFLNPDNLAEIGALDDAALGQLVANDRCFTPGVERICCS